MVPTTRLTLMIGSSARTFSPRSMAGLQSAEQVGVVERLLETVVLRLGADAADFIADIRLVEDGGEIHAFGLPVIGGFAWFRGIRRGRPFHRWCGSRTRP